MFKENPKIILPFALTAIQALKLPPVSPGLPFTSWFAVGPISGFSIMCHCSDITAQVGNRKW